MINMIRYYVLALCLILCCTVPLYAQDRPAPYEIALERIQQAAEIDALKLDLSSLGLTAVPPEIGTLEQLEVLYLGWNRLQHLPAEIGQLKNLQVLFVNSNELQQLPTEIGQLTNLAYLTAAYNRLNDLPASMSNLRKLRILNLNNNKLSQLPTQFSNLTNLTCRYCSLDISDNPLESPPPDVVKAGTVAILAYLRHQVWVDLQRLLIGSASGVGVLAALILAVRSRRTRRKEKAKRG
jgi:Leucine-rich repeat (LRR) protein